MRPRRAHTIPRPAATRRLLAALVGFAGAVVLGAPRASPAQAYTVQYVANLTDRQVVTLAGDVTGINNAGQVVGWSQRPFPAPILATEAWMTGPDGVGQRFLGFLSPPTGPGTQAYSHALGINDHGEVVGVSRNAAGLHEAFALSPNQGMFGLGFLPGGTSSFATAINGASRTVGYGTNAAGVFEAFITDRPTSAAGVTLRGLGVLPGGSFSVATGIDEMGRVVGYGDNAAGLLEAFISGPGGAGGLTGLGLLPGGTRSMARAIASSAAGWVAGKAVNAAGVTEALLMRMEDGAAGLTGLGFLPGGTESVARDVNASGRVVGDGNGIILTSTTPWGEEVHVRGTLGFVTGPGGAGGPRALPTFRSPSGSPGNPPWYLLSANAINDRGQIAGLAMEVPVRSAGMIFAVLLTPDVADPPVSTVPEPGTFVLAGTGLLALATAARRRRARGGE